MATGLIGNINAYDCNVETWTSYQERLEQYFMVNDIDNERKVAGLLTLLGEKTYGLLRNLTVPAKPSEKSYEELCQLLQTHLCPKPLIIAERFRFHKRKQAVGESVSCYVTSLRKLAEFCEFGSNLNDSLRDRFVCGLKDAGTQRRLLSIADLTLQNAIEIALAMEAAHKDAAELQLSAAADVPVNRVGHSTKPKKWKHHKHTKESSKCIHCGKTNHHSEKCRLKDAVCHHCKAKGHIKAICRKLMSVQCMEENVSVINTVNKGDNGKFIVKPKINDVQVPMELDTGSAVTLISNKDFRKRFGNMKLDPAFSILKTYSGDVIEQQGTVMVHVSYNGQSRTMRLCVVKGDGPALFGRDWLSHIKLDWDTLFNVNSVTTEGLKVRLNSILDKHKDVFSDGIGQVKGIKARLTLNENAQPKFIKARPVPYSIKPKIEKELDSLESQGIISKVDTSEWATPIVPVVKGNGDVRICGDFKVTVNQSIKVDIYPLPRIEDIFANLSNGRKYSKLDIRQAYLQLECEDETMELLTINTHRGLYRYNRMLYGVSSAPAIWQRTMDQILQGIPGVQCMLDDMVITGESDNVHLDNLQKVLCRLQQYGIRVNKDKCEFFVPRITFCGHEIDEQGLWKCQDKVEAVLNTPPPCDVTSLRAYLGVLNYYHRFLPDLATVTKPMNALLEKNRKFVWSKECQSAFEKSKTLLITEHVLTHYNPELPVRLASDASPFVRTNSGHERGNQP
ncbi:uncharacterized protein K02A2.6-like [Dreissena polymorpha]|uniref:uncharacterized protein K02A2.6-like n=1 Tax=Dreissena polymorpha TaxID=45954 RepID=UPI002265010C|nr:uncharacterized protein K02A2.6-like [Dreissena polymorpha]